MTVSLWIPVEEAARLDIDALVDKFSDSADDAGGELVDDSETMGAWEWFEFGDLSPAQVKAIAARHVPNHREIRLADEAPGDNDFIEGEHVIVVL